MNVLNLMRIRGQSSNAMTSFNLVSGISISALCGFADATARFLGGRCEAVSILCHGEDLQGERSYGNFFPNRVRGLCLATSSQSEAKKNGGLAPLSDQPFGTSHCEYSLAIRLNEEALKGFNEKGGKALKAWLLTKARFAGGVISSIGEIGVSQKAFEGRAKKVSGFMLADRRDLIANRDAGDQLDAILSILYPSEPTTKDKRWMSLNTVGFVEVSNKEFKKGTREYLPIALAEPLLGLVEYVWLEDALKNSMDLHFWRPRTFVSKDRVFHTQEGEENEWMK